MTTLILFPLMVAVAVAEVQIDYAPPDAESAMRASRFVRLLADDSPRHDGAPLRRYVIQDVDLDGTFEVLETVNEIEEAAPGFLSIEFSPPCEWVRVFTEQDGEFRERTEEFVWFLQNRRSVYQHWVDYLDRLESAPDEVRACARANLALVNELLRLN